MSLMPPRTFQASEDPALLTAQLLVRIGFGVLAIAVPVTAAFSRRALFVLLPFGAALILIAAVLSQPRRGWDRLLSALRSPIGIAALFLCLWSALSLLWTPYPVDGMQRLLKVVSTLALATVAAVFLPERMRLSSLYLLPIGVALASAMTFVIALNGGAHISGTPEGDSFTLQRAVIALIILVWPALAMLTTRGRGPHAGALAVGVAAGAIAARSPPALLALSVGALAYAASKFDLRRTALVLAVAAAVLFIAAPALPFLIKAAASFSTGAEPHWMRTVDVWVDIVRPQKARLITGHGLETMLRGMLAGYLPPGTPRSILFEVWYELGVVGAVTMAFLLARAFWTAGKGIPGVAPFLVAALAAAVTLAVLDANMAQLWWVTLLGIAAICFAAVLNGQYRTKRPVARPSIDSPPRSTAF